MNKNVVKINKYGVVAITSTLLLSILSIAQDIPISSVSAVGKEIGTWETNTILGVITVLSLAFSYKQWMHQMKVQVDQSVALQALAASMEKQAAEASRGNDLLAQRPCNKNNNEEK